MRWAVYFFIPLVVACNKPAKLPPTDSFNGDSLIDSQVKLLSSDLYSLTKFTLGDGVPDSVKLVNNQLVWANELRPLRVISLLNKPAYRNDYEISTARDQTSNLLIKTWRSKENAPVREIKIYYLNDQDQIKKLEAEIVKKNFVFSSFQSIQMEFSILGLVPRLERYKISGSQRLLLSSPDNFTLEGTIELP